MSPVPSKLNNRFDVVFSLHFLAFGCFFFFLLIFSLFCEHFCCRCCWFQLTIFDSFFSTLVLFAALVIWTISIRTSQAVKSNQFFKTQFVNHNGNLKYVILLVIISFLFCWLVFSLFDVFSSSLAIVAYESQNVADKLENKR